MSIPPDHRAFLARRGFEVPKHVPPDHSSIIERWGHWLNALVRGDIVPITERQRRFIEVASGLKPPTTIYEEAWVNAFPPCPISKATAGLDDPASNDWCDESDTGFWQHFYENIDEEIGDFYAKSHDDGWFYPEDEGDENVDSGDFELIDEDEDMSI